MKTYILIIGLSLSLFSCKNDIKKDTPKTSNTKLTIAEKIAEAHGLSNWKNVTEIKFTFNVDRDSSHFDRSFIWKPKTNQVTAITVKDTISYFRKNVDSISLRADQSFINDKFWLLPAFQLAWDKGTTISKPKREIAPISKDSLNKITLIYNSELGYTPGDAYDIFYDKNYHIKEWIFRQANQEKPSMITVFSEYKTIKGISFPTKSTKETPNWSLYFTDLKITTE
ncbi:hypothetical protein [Aurantibacter sp.]|uniref:hypothetical protein n=1 Tax=Aurantibacter sp. TaxID=2807103 RepID=UPI0035C7B45B